ncbi:MAG TPA: CRISPR-associated protein Cas4 [Saprospiraceae bacterium]|nr:CRISPR-associated protein Cas4 [Saprospiraceae bacterium]
MTPETTIRITASHIVYLLICHRKLWLFAGGIEMEHFSQNVLEGRLLHEISYPRRPSQYVEVELDGIKIDFYDPHTRTVHETKRGRAIETAHRAQVQYYLFKLRQHGVPDAAGLIEYPDLRKTEPVAPLTDADVLMIAGWEAEVQRIVAQETCPPVIKKPYCKQCAYFDLCYIGENEA